MCLSNSIHANGTRQLSLSLSLLPFCFTSSFTLTFCPVFGIQIAQTISHTNTYTCTLKQWEKKPREWRKKFTKQKRNETKLNSFDCYYFVQCFSFNFFWRVFHSPQNLNIRTHAHIDTHLCITFGLFFSFPGLPVNYFTMLLCVWVVYSVIFACIWRHGFFCCCRCSCCHRYFMPLSSTMRVRSYYAIYKCTLCIQPCIRFVGWIWFELFFLNISNAICCRWICVCMCICV